MRKLLQGNNSNYSIGAALLVAGLLLPAFLTVRSFGVYTLIHKSLQMSDSGLLVMSAFLLVLLNSIRATPIYLGTFLISSRLIFKKSLLRFFAPVLIAIEYMLISLIYDIRYDLGYVSLLVILAIYILDSLNLYNVSTLKHSAVLILMLISLQFIDVIPYLSPFGFGQGMVSMDIKSAALLIDRNNVLTMSAIGLMLIFFLMAMLIGVLLRDQHKLLIIEHTLQKSRIRALEERKNLEIRSLVHDLKSPMTSIQGLSGVISVLAQDEKIKGYAERITLSCENVSEMVSQILDSQAINKVSLQEIVDYVSKQIVSTPMRNCLLIEPVPEVVVCINKIMFSRAIVNLINNSFAAIEPEQGRIWLRFGVESGCVKIIVQDNGCGINVKDYRHIWEAGYSSQGSTGLGLGFVKSVIEDSGGTVLIESSPKLGTIASICLREVKLSE